jgi:hypothetical protein
MAQPLVETKIRMTAAMRRKYVITLVTVIVAPLVCTALYTATARGSGVVVTGWVTGVVIALVAAGLILLDRKHASYVVRGGVLRSGGRPGKHVDLPRVVDASIQTKTVKVLAPGNPYSTLVLVDCDGGRVRMMITTKRIPYLYEPEDVRAIAELLARSTAPGAQDVARQLTALTEQATRTLT